ncbi:MAG TPA: hypothetical protein VIV64_10475 [Gammaproteobacteria bacterium]|jgi:hypothetical protein
MRASQLVIAALLAGQGFTAIACEIPSLPAFPADERIRGRIERELNEEMVRYITEMSVYVACVQATYTAAEREDAPDRHLALLAARNNGAIDELESVRDIYVARVGPIEELFFEQSFDAGGRRRDAQPRFAPIPTGPDNVLRRTEIILGDDNCPEIAPCDIDVSSAGRERNLRPPIPPTRSVPGR